MLLITIWVAVSDNQKFSFDNITPASCQKNAVLCTSVQVTSENASFSMSEIFAKYLLFSRYDFAFNRLEARLYAYKQLLLHFS